MKLKDSTKTTPRHQNSYRRPQELLLNPIDELYKRDFDDNPDWCPSDSALEQIFDLAKEIEYEKGQADIEELTIDLKKDFLAYIRIGIRLSPILFYRLYKKTHSQFAQYCLDVLGIREWQARNYIKASRVFLTLMRGGFTYLQLPKNLSQCLTLSQYEDDELIEKWQLVCKKFKPYEYRADKIDNFLHPRPLIETYDTKIDLQLPVVKNTIEKLALAQEMSISQLMLEMVEVYQTYYKMVKIPNEKSDCKKSKRRQRRKHLREWGEKLRNLNIQIEELNLEFDGTPQRFP